MGPGRGYCAKGGFLTVRYPPIGDSGVMDAAREKAATASRVVALITDIGNDIMYGVPEQDIVACLSRLLKEFEAMNADVFLNPVPLVIEEDVTPFQFRLLRRIFYRSSAVEYTQAAHAVREVNRFLRDSAGGRVHLLQSAREFCGADKIHYSLFRSHRAWSRIVAEMLRVLPATPAGAIAPFSTWKALFANMGRLFFCDLIPVRKKISGTF